MTGESVQRLAMNLIIFGGTLSLGGVINNNYHGWLEIGFPVMLLAVILSIVGFIVSIKS